MHQDRDGIRREGGSLRLLGKALKLDRENGKCLQYICLELLGGWILHLDRAMLLRMHSRQLKHECGASPTIGNNLVMRWGRASCTSRFSIHLFFLCFSFSRADCLSKKQWCSCCYSSLSHMSHATGSTTSRTNLKFWE